MKKKYRLVRTTYASGMVLWCIERKFLFWWEYLDSYLDHDKASMVLAALRAGNPYRHKVPTHE